MANKSFRELVEALNEMSMSDQIRRSGNNIVVPTSDGKTKSLRIGGQVRFKDDGKTKSGSVRGIATRGSYKYVKVDGSDNHLYHVTPNNII